jgi:hypothetical protein
MIHVRTGRVGLGLCFILAGSLALSAVGAWLTVSAGVVARCTMVDPLGACAQTTTPWPLYARPVVVVLAVLAVVGHRRTGDRSTADPADPDVGESR